MNRNQNYIDLARTMVGNFLVPVGSLYSYCLQPVKVYTIHDQVPRLLQPVGPIVGPRTLRVESKSFGLAGGMPDLSDPRGSGPGAVGIREMRHVAGKFFIQDDAWQDDEHQVWKLVQLGQQKLF